MISKGMLTIVAGLGLAMALIFFGVTWWWISLPIIFGGFALSGIGYARHKITSGRAQPNVVDPNQQPQQNQQPGPIDLRMNYDTDQGALKVGAWLDQSKFLDGGMFFDFLAQMMQMMPSLGSYLLLMLYDKMKADGVPPDQIVRIMETQQREFAQKAVQKIGRLLEDKQEGNQGQVKGRKEPSTNPDEERYGRRGSKGGIFGGWR